MPFFSVEDIPAIQAAPGCKIRTPFGDNLMLSHIEIDENAEVPMHHHPHEQGGIVLQGRLELTIGSEVRILEAGQMYIIPSNTPHKAVAIDGPAVAMDVFTPVREDYVAMISNSPQ